MGIEARFLSLGYLEKKREDGDIIHKKEEIRSRC